MTPRRSDVILYSFMSADRLMAQFLANKRILLGITGSVAAYKSADLVRRLREIGANVRVVMTANAKRFITPLTMQAVSGYPVHDELFDLQAEAAMGHIELARWAELILVAPASADLMARLAYGHADDLLTTLCLASKAPVVLAPAMNQAMYTHVLTQENKRRLKEHGVIVLGTGEGSQACGDVGPGRMLEPLTIIETINELFSTYELAGKKVVITAGPTHEAIDPVRYLTNGSSGKMGYALAEAAASAGAQVILVSGPVSLAKPKHIEVISVTTAKEMQDAVFANVSDCDIFISVAAVSDYQAQTVAPKKMPKESDAFSLILTPTPDIVANVAALSAKPFVVGFAAETDDVITKAKQKRERKKMDMIIANQVGEGRGMGSDENEVTIISARQEKILPLMSKSDLAKELITLIANEYKQGQQT